jgi:hypothetical protein
MAKATARGTNEPFFAQGKYPQCPSGPDLLPAREVWQLYVEIETLKNLIWYRGHLSNRLVDSQISERFSVVAEAAYHTYSGNWRVQNGSRLL